MNNPNPPPHGGRDGVTDERLRQIQRLAVVQFETAGTPRGPGAYREYEMALMLAAPLLITELQSRRSYTPPGEAVEAALKSLRNVLANLEREGDIVLTEESDWHWLDAAIALLSCSSAPLSAGKEE